MKNLLKTATAARPNGSDRRREIETAAFHLFAKNGFRGTTTKEIAQIAGISEAGLFQYYGTKAELYAAVLEQESKDLAVNDWLSDIDRFAERNDDVGLFNFIAAKISENCIRNPDFLRLMLYSALEGHESAKLFNERQTNHLFAILTEYIKRRQHENAFQKCNAEAVAQSFIGAQLHFAMTEMLAGSGIFGDVSKKESIADFTGLLLDRLRASGQIKDS